MRLAFDSRCESGKASSFTRVLELWRHAADVVGLEYSNWHDGSCSAEVLISPNGDVATIKGPVKVATFHDVNALQPQPSSWLRRAPAIHALTKASRNLQLNAKHIITGSEFAKQSIGQAFPALDKKLFVIPHYPSPMFTPGDVDHQLLAQHRIPENCILFVSAIRKHKNHEGLFKAWLKLPKDLRQRHPLVFVASAKKVSRKIKATPNVFFTGRIDETVLLNLYRSAALMVFPSFAEGFGLPPLEAIACGCPVIASNATCIPEVLGNAASFFDPFDTLTLTSLLSQHIDQKPPSSSAPSWSAELTGAKLKEFLTTVK